MSPRKKGPLRAPTLQEQQVLSRLSHSRVAPAAEVARAKMLLAVADGKQYLQAAREAGRKSGDTVTSLVARFNVEGLQTLTTRAGKGRQPTYDDKAKLLIL